MEYNSNEIDLLAEALPEECLAMIMSHLELIELVNLSETSKYFAARLDSPQKWMSKINLFFGPADEHNLRNRTPKLNWYMMFEIESLITEPPARKSYPEDMPQACRDFARSLETAQVPRHFLAMSNEYIVFSEAVERSPEIKAHVYRIQPTGFSLAKTIKTCVAHYWHKALNILVLVKHKGIVKLHLDDATQECTRVFVVPSVWRRAPNSDYCRPVVKDVRQVAIKGTLSLIVTIDSHGVIVFVDLTKREVLNVLHRAVKPHWLCGTKVALLHRSTLAVVNIAEKDKHKRFIASGIQYNTPILDFAPNKSGRELFVATFGNQALEIRVCLWPIGVFLPTDIRFPTPVVPSLNMKYKSDRKILTINALIQIKLAQELS